VIQPAAGPDTGAVHRRCLQGSEAENAANIEVARQAEAPGAMIWRVPDGPSRPRPASRGRAAILIVILLAAAARSARLAEVAVQAHLKNT